MLICVLLFAAPKFDRLIQILPTIESSAQVMEKMLDEAQRLNRGITVSLGVTDDGSIFAQARWPQWKYFDPMLDGAISRRLPKVRLKIGGGPPPHPTWRAFNGGDAWEASNRPPRGENDALWKQLVKYKQYVIDRAVAKMKAAGLEPKEFLEIELGTEPGKGGSGGPWKSAYPFTYASPYDRLPEGTWDDAYHEQLSFECSQLDFKGLTVLSPAFECQDTASFSQELSTFDSPKGAAWRSKVDVWVVNLYANLSDRRERGLVAAVRAFRAKAMWARNVMWQQRGIGENARLAVGELGWTHATLNLSGARTSEAERSRGEALRACEDAARGLGFESVSIYTMADDEYGLFDRKMKPSPALAGFISRQSE